MTTRNRRRITLAIVTATVIAALSWLAIVASGGDVPVPMGGVAAIDSNEAPVQSEAAVRSTIAKAKVEARTHTTSHPVVLPPDPPPVGVPTWVRVRPGDHAPEMPTPRGSYK